MDIIPLKQNLIIPSFVVVLKMTNSNHYWTGQDISISLFYVPNVKINITFLNVCYRFARMFFEPLLDKDNIIRGIGTVDFKFKNNLANDIIRVEQVLRSSAVADHPYSRFGIGN